MEWKTIQINKQNIKAETNNAILIALPHNSLYDKWQFWHPIKLITKGKHPNAIGLIYNDDFNFRIYKYSRGNHPKIIDEDSIDAEVLEYTFEKMNENITRSQKDNNSYLIIEEPKKVCKNVEVLEELKNG